MLKTQIVGGVAASELSPGQVAREFRNLLEEGARLKVVGSAREDPTSLLSLGYTPRYKLELFGATFYLTNLREDDNFRFFVAYVLLPGRPASEGHPPAHLLQGLVPRLALAEPLHPVRATRTGSARATSRRS